MTLPPIQPCPSQIADAGLYDIPISRYHGDPRLCTGPSVSSTVIKAALDCPARAWNAWSQNPDAIPPDSDALRYGRARHSWLEGQEAFARDCVVSPYDDFRSKEAREWRAAETRVVLKPAQLDEFRAMDKALELDTYASRAIKRSVAEASMIAQDEATGLWLRARPDFLMPVTGGLYALDYKTADSVSPHIFPARAFNYGYHVQAGVADMVCEAATGQRLIGYALIVQEKAPPYLTVTYALQPDQIEWGRARARLGLDVIARCLEQNHWPGYADEPIALETPAWAVKQMEEQINDDDSSREAEYEPADYLAAG